MHKITNKFLNRKIRKEFAYVGVKSVIFGPIHYFKPKYIYIYNDVIIFEGARIECYNKYNGVSMNPTFKIGSYSRIGKNFTALVADELTIGENTLIASNVFISTENHGMNPEMIYYKQPLLTQPVHIGSNCWIGEKVIILPGVTIGDCSIIGAGSVVTKNIPPYTIAVGNPAKVIKKWDEKNKERVKIK